MKSQPIQILKADELWQYITLADGTIIKHRTIILGIFRNYDDNGNALKNDDKSPVYGFKLQNLMVVEKFEGEDIIPVDLKSMN